MSQPANPDRAGARGFTLVETLVALAVTAVVLSAIGTLANAGLRAGLHVEAHFAQLATARKVLAGLPPRAGLREGATDGELDGRRWRLEIAPLAGGAAPAGAAKWRPVSVVLRVGDPRGGALSFETVRLVKAAQ